MTSGEPAIKTVNLTKSFRHFKAVDQLNLEVGQGEIFGFLGPNGAGKTTTLRMLAGLSKPDSGEIILSGKPVIFGSKTGREKIGYLPDVPECYGYMKPLEFLSFCGALYGLDARSAKKKSAELLERVGLTASNKRIGGFSRGMKQRLGIAQALINDPDIIFMDEPVSALDPTGRYEVLDILKNLRGNTTVFFSTHIISDIEKVCDRIAIINKGVMLEQGAINDLKIKYDNKILSVGFPMEAQKEQIDRLADMIREKSWCSGLWYVNGNQFKIQITDRMPAQMQLPSMISECGLPLETMDSLSISLEEVFLKVVGK